MPGLGTAMGMIERSPEVREALAWLAVPANRGIVRESPFYRTWLILRDSQPATAFEAMSQILRGPCERIPVRELPDPDQAELLIALAYLQNVVTFPGLAPVAARIPVATGDEPFQFRKWGDHWVVRFRGGKRLLVEPSIGMDYYHVLIEHPGQSTVSPGRARMRLVVWQWAQ